MPLIQSTHLVPAALCSWETEAQRGKGARQGHLGSRWPPRAWCQDHPSDPQAPPRAQWGRNGPPCRPETRGPHSGWVQVPQELHGLEWTARPEAPAPHPAPVTGARCGTRFAGREAVSLGAVPRLKAECRWPFRGLGRRVWDMCSEGRSYDLRLPSPDLGCLYGPTVTLGWPPPWTSTSDFIFGRSLLQNRFAPTHSQGSSCPQSLLFPGVSIYAMSQTPQPLVFLHQPDSRLVGPAHPHAVLLRPFWFLPSDLATQSSAKPCLCSTRGHILSRSLIYSYQFNSVATEQLPSRASCHAGYQALADT